MKTIVIVLLCILAASLYGIVHDQVTARICVEYFTIGHPPVFHTTDPTLLGLGWGILATWWVGLLLGIPLAFAALSGKRPQRTVASLVRPITLLLGGMACCAALAGILGFMLAKAHLVYLIEPLASDIPAPRQILFLSEERVAFSYFPGTAGTT